MFRNCTFRDCKLERLSLGFAELVRCSFVDCDIRELVAFDASLQECLFQGRIQRGIISISSEGRYVTRSVNRVENNDFVQCELRDVGFRGGISLSPSSFSAEAQAGLILDANGVIERRLLGDCSVERLTPRQQARVRFIQQYVDDYKQPDVFLGLSIVERDAPDVRALMQILTAP